MAAGAATGALYKCTGKFAFLAQLPGSDTTSAGVRPMLMASLVMTGAAGVWSTLKQRML